MGIFAYLRTLYIFLHMRETTEYLKTEGSLKSETWNVTEEAGRRSLNMEHTRPFHFWSQDHRLTILLFSIPLQLLKSPADDPAQF